MISSVIDLTFELINYIVWIGAALTSGGDFFANMGF